MNGTEESLDLILSVLIDDEPACEFRHHTTTCSVEVTHRVQGCKSGAAVCTTAAEFKAGDRLTATCNGCGKPAVECWRIWPI